MGIAQIIVDKKNIHATEVNNKNIISKINKKYKQVISDSIEKLRGFKITKKKKKKKKVG